MYLIERNKDSKSPEPCGSEVYLKQQICWKILNMSQFYSLGLLAKIKHSVCSQVLNTEPLLGLLRLPRQELLEHAGSAHMSS